MDWFEIAMQSFVDYTRRRFLSPSMAKARSTHQAGIRPYSVIHRIILTLMLTLKNDRLEKNDTIPSNGAGLIRMYGL